MNLSYIFIVFVLFITSLTSYYLKKLTLFGSLTAFLIGLIVYTGIGYLGLLMLILFFVFGTGATHWKVHKKNKFKVYQIQKNGRNALQVIANGGIAAFLSFLAILFPKFLGTLQIMVIGSISAALADTLSSELGMIYGSAYFDIISFKKVDPGPDGVISMEGLLIGLLGSAIISFVYCILTVSFHPFFIIILAGTIGNVADSLLGATLERNGFIQNNIVNFLNTMVGALVCLFLLY